MASRIGHTSVDCRDAYTLSLFWSAVLGMVEDPEDPNEPGHEECMIFSADGSVRVLFIETPDSKITKNRLHFDLRPTDRTRDAEIDRVLALGATEIEDLRTPDGLGWMVLADPEGNEFCILRSASELSGS